MARFYWLGAYAAYLCLVASGHWAIAQAPPAATNYVCDTTSPGCCNSQCTLVAGPPSGNGSGGVGGGAATLACQQDMPQQTKFRRFQYHGTAQATPTPCCTITTVYPYSSCANGRCTGTVQGTTTTTDPNGCV